MSDATKAHGVSSESNGENEDEGERGKTIAFSRTNASSGWPRITNKQMADAIKNANSVYEK